MAEQLFFYGAGCNCMQNNLRITKAVAKYLNSCTAIEIASDLVAAGRALFGSGRGVVCILGTGSNCGLYEDGQIISNVPPLGYILGDEGSGSAIGKAILKAALRNELIDKSIITDICEIFECRSSGIVPRIYRGDAPNKALAQIAFVAYNHYSDLQVQQIVDEEFNRFSTTVWQNTAIQAARR